MLQEIRDLGFEYAELSHGIRISLLPGIMEAVDAGVIRISTVHNFCPLPMGVNHAAPNIYRFSAADARERDKALRQSIKTLDTAVRLGASLVVLHLGNIEMREYTDRLMRLLEKGKQDTPKYQKLCNEVLEKRESKKEKYVDWANGILTRLADEAESRGVKLGVENRESLEEIPLEPDFPFLFKDFEGRPVVYWHDVGHAQIKENLGFISHSMHLESLSEQLAGFHIHDVQFPGKDHCVPGSGTVDFERLKDVVKPDHIKVFEMNPGIPADDMMAGVRYLKAIWGDD